MLVGRLHGQRRAAAREHARDLLARFDLLDAAGRPAKGYSGGMRRRLDLAAALVSRPSVLFLDEPTTGLDPRSRLALWSTIEGLVADGTTVLLTTQYLDEADRLADRIAVIDRGRVIADGTTDELKDRLRGERLEVRLVDPAAVPRATAALRALGEIETAGAAGDGIVTAQLHTRDGAIVQAVRRLDAAGIDVEDVALRRPTLDDVFLSLTGHTADDRARGGGGMSRLVTDTLIVAERNLVRLPRTPDLFVAFTIQPVMFVLLFVYVFGGAIVTPGYDYVDFLIPGIIVQNIAFGGFGTALGLCEDLTRGLVDRFRSLPMSRAAILAGRTLADLATNALALVILLATGLLLGFSFNAGVAEIAGGIALLLLFGYAFSWVFALLGASVSSPEAANSLGFMAVFPLTFISSAFVPIDSMPDGLREFAEVNPFTVLCDAMRRLWLDAPDGSVVAAVAWSLAIIAVFAPLAVRRYQRAAGG